LADHPERSQTERTRRRDRRLKFYELWDILLQAAHQLLDSSFPPTVHDAIATAVGIDMASTADVAKTKRDPAFRNKVLVAYEYRCAVCDWDGRLDNAPLGLDAAHVRWHALGGPDDVDNSLCLCSFHHLALDRGALSIGDDLTILVSQTLNGGSRVHAWLACFAGEELRQPQHGYQPPKLEYREWHQAEVFRHPARVGPA